MVDYGRYRFLEVRHDDGVTTIVLSRPERRNAVHEAMHRELEDIWADVAEDDGIRAIVLTGAGEAFCAGGDAGSMDSGEFDPRGPAIRFNGVRRLVNHLLDVEQPIVAAVNGDAAGLGATLAQVLDEQAPARAGEPGARQLDVPRGRHDAERGPQGGGSRLPGEAPTAI